MVAWYYGSVVVWWCGGVDVKGSSSVFFVGQLVKGRQTKGQSIVQKIVQSIVQSSEVLNKSSTVLIYYRNIHC